MKNKLIALDCDGVLLDYNLAYASAWERAFGHKPTLKNPDAYWASEMWDVKELVGDELIYFRKFFDTDHWSSIPPIEAAVESVHRLVEAGFNVVCVTALDHEFGQARAANLKQCLFPEMKVITAPKIGLENPKAKIINQLNPIAFVDDFEPYFSSVDDGIHKALIERGFYSSSVNKKSVTTHSSHKNLKDFVDYWL